MLYSCFSSLFLSFCLPLFFCVSILFLHAMLMSIFTLFTISLSLYFFLSTSLFINCNFHDSLCTCTIFLVPSSFLISLFLPVHLSYSFIIYIHLSSMINFLSLSLSLSLCPSLSTSLSTDHILL